MKSQKQELLRIGNGFIDRHGEIIKVYVLSICQKNDRGSGVEIALVVGRCAHPAAAVAGIMQTIGIAQEPAKTIATLPSPSTTDGSELSTKLPLVPL